MHAPSALSFLSGSSLGREQALLHDGRAPEGAGQRVREAARHSREQTHSWAFLCRARKSGETFTLENILQSLVTDIRSWTFIPDIH